ncbi:MAG: AAA family ATPase [Alphaproteobacteria bacterium]|nr:AAA family ATPase [Alphaproteobacteria bacterium]
MTNDEILEHFSSDSEFRAILDHWGPNSDLARRFCRLARAVHNVGLDWYHVQAMRKARFGRKNHDNQNAQSVAGYISVSDNSVHIKSNDTWQGTAIESIPSDYYTVLDNARVQEIEIELTTEWDGIPHDLRRDSSNGPPGGLWPDEYLDCESESGQDNDARSVEASPHHSLNTILYGPPGAGKTYATFRRCVEICDGKKSLKDEDVGDRYRKLVKEGRVEFVTFHQSYGYEEFVEGLRPQTDTLDTEDRSSAGFRLHAEDGVLKRIAERARKVPARSATPFTLDHRRVFKMGLGNPTAASEQGIFQECVDNGCVLLGWGGNVDWSDPTFGQYNNILERWKIEDDRATGYDSNVKFIHCFRNTLTKNDLIVVPTSQQRFRAVGEVTGAYEFSQRDDGIYPHRRNVHWLWVDTEGTPFLEIYDFQITPQTIYQLSSQNLKKDRLIRYASRTEESVSVQPHVLVIDEINRGNISKVFGEAITLVEEDKRAGSPNEISVTLPYSGKSFSLPPNLYILGTMNTADRSIALLDTALRRRFDFEELAPKPELLEEAARACKIDLPAVLKAMNERLEWLLSRDHLIGHAWLIAARSKEDVDRIMRRKIIPMLAEYFHEDWSRVRAVLGGGNEFIEMEKLGAPPAMDNADIGEDRYRWTIRENFWKDAYHRLITGKPRQADSSDDGSEVDSA